MLKLEIKFDDAGASAALTRLSGVLSSRQDLHQAMAAGLEDAVRSHLTDLGKSRSPNTGYFGKAARSVQSSSTPTVGTTTIPHRGMALLYYGGRVVPTTMKNLALPTENVPIRGGERMRPGEMKDLAYLPAKKSAKPGTTGYLVEGMASSRPGGKSRLVPKPDGRLMFVLRSYTDHKEDSTVLPGQQIMRQSAKSAGMEYLAAALHFEGGAQ